MFADEFDIDEAVAPASPARGASQPKGGTASQPTIGPRTLAYAVRLAMGLVFLGCSQSPSPAPTISSASAAAEQTPTATEAAKPAGADDVTLPTGGAPPDAWPLFRGDSQGSGVSQSTLPDKPALVWQFQSNAQAGGFEGTCAIAGGVVFAPSLDGHLYALDLATGQEKWKFFSELGFVASPAVRDGLVYIGDVNGRFFALDAATGEGRWGFEAKAEIDSCANFYNDTVLVGSQDATLYCRRATTGEPVWQYSIEDQVRCMPTLVGDRAFLAGCDSKLHVIDLTTGQSIGKVEIDSPTGCTPALTGDRVFFGTEGETFFGIDWRQEKVLWRYRNSDRSFPYRSSAVVLSDRVLVGGRDKLMRALAADDGQELWRFTSKARIDGSAVVVGRRAFFGSGDGRLYAVDIASGEAVWEYEAGGGFASSPAVASGKLVIGNDDGALLCFGAADLTPPSGDRKPER